MKRSLLFALNRINCVNLDKGKYVDFTALNRKEYTASESTFGLLQMINRAYILCPKYALQ
jgi:hypothetical protein